MSLAKIIWAISAAVAVLLAFVATGYNSAILALLGLLSGWFLDHDHRRGVIIAALFLMLGGQNALGGIPAIGGHLNAILASLGAVFSGAAVLAILRTLIERLFSSDTKAPSA